VAQPVVVGLHPDLLAKLDAFRAVQPDTPTRSAVIRKAIAASVDPDSKL
jgi:metal-responsive CopG/Arc/MetJ family transcriptional regulator